MKSILLFDPQTFAEWLTAYQASAPIRVIVSENDGISAGTAALIGASISAVAALVTIYLTNRQQRKLSAIQREHDWYAAVNQRHYEELKEAIDLLGELHSVTAGVLRAVVAGSLGKQILGLEAGARIQTRLWAIISRRAVHLIAPDYRSVVKARTALHDAVQELSESQTVNERVAAIEQAYDNATTRIGTLTANLLFVMTELEEFPPKNHFEKQLKRFSQNREKLVVGDQVDKSTNDAS